MTTCLSQRFSILLAMLLLAFPLTVGAQEKQNELPTGEIVAHVASRKDPAQTYALYLPSTYTPDRKWPILYCFDPIARGEVPVRAFQAAAETFGWIVVGSHVSRNGSVRNSLEAGQAMWDDTHARFAIDERRRYAAGFSGGARMATLIASNCQGCIAGVVACGAGFMSSSAPTRESLSKSPLPFALYMTAGWDDFNFPELIHLDEVLASAGAPHHFERFEGGHQWSTVEVSTKAVEWLEVQAIKAGLRPKDDALISRILARHLAEARAHEAADRPFEAWLVYADAVSSLQGLADTSEAASRARELAKSKAVREALEQESKQAQQQARYARELVGLANLRKDQEQRLFAIQEYRRRLGDLRRQSQKEEDSPERRVARRALHQVFAHFFEGGMGLAAEGKTGEAVDSLELAAEMAPSFPGVLLELAAAYARSGDRKKALETLREAAEKGLADTTRLQTAPAFEELRSEPEFQQILESVKKGKSR